MYRTIDQLDVAALGPSAPLPPGTSKLPGPGQYYACLGLLAALALISGTLPFLSRITRSDNARFE
ncbi:MAG TPA: hypothetical protein VF892_26365 [Pseudonocardiaceae bacterium]